MEGEDSQWILERATTTSRIGSLSASTTISMAIWPKNARERKRRKLRSVSNMTKRDTL